MTRLVFGILLLLLATAPLLAADRNTDVDLDGRNVATEETNLGNFVADAIRNAAGSDIAIVHAMAFRAGALISKGGVDDLALNGALAFPTNGIYTMQLTAVQLRSVMQRALSKYPDPNTAFLQVAGMTVTFDSSKPAATRVTGITVKGKAVDFFDNKTTYTVAMPQVLANGAVGYLLIFTGPVLDTRKAVDVTLTDAINREFARQAGTVKPAVDGRLKDTAPKKDEAK